MRQWWHRRWSWSRFQRCPPWIRASTLIGASAPASRGLSIESTAAIPLLHLFPLSPRSTPLSSGRSNARPRRRRRRPTPPPALHLRHGPRARRLRVRRPARGGARLRGDHAAPPRHRVQDRRRRHAGPHRQDPSQHRHGARGASRGARRGARPAAQEGQGGLRHGEQAGQGACTARVRVLLLRGHRQGQRARPFSHTFQLGCLQCFGGQYLSLPLSSATNDMSQTHFLPDDWINCNCHQVFASWSLSTFED